MVQVEVVEEETLVVGGCCVCVFVEEASFVVDGILFMTEREAEGYGEEGEEPSFQCVSLYFI